MRASIGKEHQMAYMDVLNQIKFIGIDAQGRRRVFGTAVNSDIAETRCRHAAIEYVKDRPDTGPLSAWIIQREE